MSIFKFLKGNSSRISTDITPFQDGYVYFTPDDGALYIDAAVGSENRRIKVGASRAIDSVLFADKWENWQQTIQIPEVKDGQNGLCSMKQGASNEQVEAVQNAGIYISAQKAGEVTFRYTDKIPQIDIPITIILLG